MKKILSVLSVILCLVFTNNASAATTIMKCNTCETNTSLYVKAIKHAKSEANNSYMGFQGDIIVVNYLQNKVKGWNISAKWLMQGGDDPNLVIRMYSINPPSNITNQVNIVSETKLFQHFRIARRSGIFVPIKSGFDSAWDIARNGSNHAALDQWYHDEYPINYWTTELANIIGGIGVLPGVLEGIEITFQFADGSSIRLKAAKITSGILSFVYVAGSAQDADGNPIGDQGQSLAGGYNFSSDERMNAFLAEAQKAGYTTYTTSPGGGIWHTRVTIIDLH